MCIVPVSEAVAKAMETRLFKQLLAALGLQQPSQQVRSNPRGGGGG